jgi:hypothetical protein
VALADAERRRPRAGTRSRPTIKVLMGGGLDVSLILPGRGSHHAGGHRCKTARYALTDDERTRRPCLLLTGSTAPVVASRDDSARADRLAQPPSGFGIFLQEVADASADVFTGDRKMRVRVSPGIDLGELRPAQEVVPSEALNVVIAQGYETIGEVVMLKEILGGDGALVISHADEERIARLAGPLRQSTPAGWTSRSRSSARIPRRPGTASPSAWWAPCRCTPTVSPSTGARPQP